MTVCYLIQTYKNPEQIYRLVRLIQRTSSDCFIVVSHNFDSCWLNTIDLQKFKNVKVIQNNGVMMGSFSIIQGLFDAIDWLLSKKIKFDWLINITGQDYPTQPLYKIENFLQTTDYDGFIEYFDVHSQQNPWSRNIANTRYLYNYKHSQRYTLPWQRLMLKPIKHIINNCQPFVRLHYSYGISVGVKSCVKLFNNNFICYGGSYFATISRKCVTYLHNFLKQNPCVLDYYKKTFIPEESLMQTVLVNSKKFNLYNGNFRYMDFTNSRYGHPRILTNKDFSVMTKENIHFARKFDIKEDSGILDKLDQRIFTDRSINIPLAEFVTGHNHSIQSVKT